MSCLNCVRVCEVRGHWFDPPSHSCAHAKDAIYAKIIAPFVRWVCMWERAHARVPVGHRKMTHCCHSSKNKGFTELVTILYNFR